MKEISVEEKAKRYDEAIKRAKSKIKNDKDHVLYEDDVIDIFPELKESEERIKDCIGICLTDADEQRFKDFNTTLKDCLDWLHNQGENAYNEELSKLLHKVICHFINNPDIPYSKRDEVSKKVIPYVEKLEKQNEQNLNPCDGCINRKGCINCENGELREIEQKPADKVEPFDKYKGLTDFERTLADICIGWIGEEYGWKQYIKDNADVLLKIAIKMFNSVQDAPFEQTTAWSEEDENHIQHISDFIMRNRVGDTDAIYRLEQDVKWLKSLKDRVQPQPKWSEEDEKNLRVVVDYLIADNGLTLKHINWLKSLKDRYTWKPSDEQIRRLEYFLKLWGKTEDIENTKVFETVKSLLNDLKKLREE